MDYGLQQSLSCRTVWTQRKAEKGEHLNNMTEEMKESQGKGLGRGGNNSSLVPFPSGARIRTRVTSENNNSSANQAPVEACQHADYTWSVNGVNNRPVGLPS